MAVSLDSADRLVAATRLSPWHWSEGDGEAKEFLRVLVQDTDPDVAGTARWTLDAWVEFKELEADDPVR